MIRDSRTSIIPSVLQAPRQLAYPVTLSTKGIFKWVVGIEEYMMRNTAQKTLGEADKSKSRLDEAQARKIMKDISPDDWGFMPDSHPEYNRGCDSIEVSFSIEYVEGKKYFADLNVTLDIFSGELIGDASLNIMNHARTKKFDLRIEGGFANELFHKLRTSRLPENRKGEVDGSLPPLPNVDNK